MAVILQLCTAILTFFANNAGLQFLKILFLKRLKSMLQVNLEAEILLSKIIV